MPPFSPIYKIHAVSGDALVEQRGQQSWGGGLADGTVDSSSRHAFTSRKTGGVSKDGDSQQTGMVDLP